MAEQTKATPGAQKRAEEAGLDLSSIEGTGADGQVTTQDVDKTVAAIQAAEEEGARAAAEAESQELIVVKLNPALVEEGVTTVVAGGRTWPSRQPVSRADFEENLKPAKDTEGRQVLHIGKVVK